MKLADIPDRTIRPVDAEPSTIRDHVKSQAIRRRGILKGMAGAAMVLGISALDLLPGRNNAHASIQNPSSVWRWWNHCRDYSNAAWRICNPDVASVSEAYCQPADRSRHRVDYVETDDCNWTDYIFDARCGIYDGKNVQAWRWYRSNDGDPGGPASVVCSDGKIFRSTRCRTTRFNSTCRRYL